METVTPKKDRIFFGKRAFASKPIPACRRDEYSDYRKDAYSRQEKGQLVSVPRSLLHLSHLLCVGMTRCGKSAGCCLPLIRQMLEPYTESWTTPGGKEHTEERRSVVTVTDMKKDKGFANTCARFAREAGVDCMLLTEDPNNSWAFDPFSCISGNESDAAYFAPAFNTAMQQDFGAGFGEQYYTTMCLDLSYETIKHLSKVKANGGHVSFDEAVRYIQKNAKYNPKDSGSLLSTLKLLRHYPHLQPRSGDLNVIDPYDFFKKNNGGLIIVSLDGLNQGPIARLIAALFNANVLAAKKRIADEQEGEVSPPYHCWSLYDEAQHLTSRAMSSFLTGAAGYGLTCALSVQSMSGFKLRNLDLRSDIWNNTAIKCLFTPNEESDALALQGYSRETIRPLGSRTVASDFRYFGRQALNAESESDRLETLLSRREIQEVSRQRNRCFFVSEGGDDFEPIVTDTFYSETYEEHLASKAKPWPKPPTTNSSKTAKKVKSLALEGKKNPPWLEAHLSTNKSEVHAARIDRFNALLKELRDEELPEE